MARKNRVVVPDGIYHVTSRICHKALLFKPDELKVRIVDWMIDIARFSGVELYAWCIMDNHIHMLVHVPRVPQRYWCSPDVEPESWAFGMRPPACRTPLWTDGDSLRPPEQRPDLGFMLSDEEMLERLSFLYSRNQAAATAVRWARMRAMGADAAVDDEKGRYCRRMYNISQFVKTFKERISMRYNADEEFKHEGCLWQGRFYSGIVENAREVMSIVAAYIEYNPVKAGMVQDAREWQFNSFSSACGSGRWSEYCRGMYERMLGCEWEEIMPLMERIFDDKLPNGVTEDNVNEFGGGDNGEVSDGTENQKVGRIRYRASQMIHVRTWFMRSGGYIGRTMEFATQVVAHLPTGFPRIGFRSVRCCRAFCWEWLARAA